MQSVFAVCVGSEAGGCEFANGFVKNLNKEFVVGIVLVSVSPLKAATQEVEIQVSKVNCIKPLRTKNGGVCGG